MYNEYVHFNQPNEVFMKVRHSTRRNSFAWTALIMSLVFLTIGINASNEPDIAIVKVVITTR